MSNFTYTVGPNTRVLNKFDGEYAFLSNFYMCSLDLQYGDEVITFPSVEHAFQACKTTDVSQAKRLSMEPTPASAKRAGGPRGYITLRPDWEQIKYDIMHKLVYQKFVSNEILAKRLLGTGDAILIEGNTWRDTDWGMCNGLGENNLGIILMKVRAELQKVMANNYNRDRCWSCLLRCKFCENQLTCTMRGDPERMKLCTDHCCFMTIEECDTILDSIKR